MSKEVRQLTIQNASSPSTALAVPILVEKGTR